MVVIWRLQVSAGHGLVAYSYQENSLAQVLLMISSAADVLLFDKTPASLIILSRTKYGLLIVV